MKLVLAVGGKGFYSSSMRFSISNLTRPSLPLVLVSLLAILIWTAGGASRGDAVGQAVVRGGAWLSIVIAVIAGPRADFNLVRPAAILLIAIIAVPVFQLIPLSPAWLKWMGDETLFVRGQPSGWRSLTIVPGATINALASLVLPAALILLMAQAEERHRQTFLTILLAIVFMSVLVGLFQLSGMQLNNPFVNDVPGNVSGTFANRNHFALFLAMGCVLAPAWALADSRALSWRGPIAAALVLLLLLTVLAIGSRSGLVLAAIALIISGTLFANRLKHQMSQMPTWLLPSILAALVVTICAFVWLSFAADRVEAVDRLLAFSVEDDLRVRARPILLTMIELYLPFGTGLGSFDSAFRMHEPTSLLALQYFNQAHNDYLGIALDAGVPGLLVLMSAIAWWGVATFRVLRLNGDQSVWLARIGSALLLLVFVASITDYPARTPLIMIVVAVAASWLAIGSRPHLRSTLPQRVRAV